MLVRHEGTGVSEPSPAGSVSSTSVPSPSWIQIGWICPRRVMLRQCSAWKNSCRSDPPRSSVMSSFSSWRYDPPICRMSLLPAVP